jgi:chemotaxis protein MotB
MARRRIEESPENHERWMVSYADFITLLLAFFVVLYSISSLNEKKYDRLSEILEGIFTVENRSLRPVQVGDIAKQTEKTDDLLMPDPQAKTSALGSADGYGKSSQIGELDEIANRLETSLTTLIKQGDVSVHGSESWTEISLNSGLLFQSGRAVLSESSDAVLYDIGMILRDYPNAINIEGFTDNVPVSGGKFVSNWELSTSRAAAVVRMLIDVGVEPSRMAAVGYGEFQPIANNLNIGGRKKNRRVVIVVAKTALQGRSTRNAPPKRR